MIDGPFEPSTRSNPADDALTSFGLPCPNLTYSDLMISRREFALLAAGLAAPGRVLGKRRRRSSGAPERKFLFLFNDGGWDTGYAFTDRHRCWCGPRGRCGARVGDIDLRIPRRPSIRDFFQTHGSRTAIINGIEVRSVTHERCDSSC